MLEMSQSFTFGRCGPLRGTGGPPVLRGPHFENECSKTHTRTHTHTNTHTHTHTHTRTHTHTHTHTHTCSCLSDQRGGGWAVVYRLMSPYHTSLLCPYACSQSPQR